ncbi:hypothetical protein F2P56_013295 [Juglans regia]|uniref:Uncharacterized protein n=1 Tax=Juglans regia TaxID=51240 RepID=A0A834CZK9_JUGRE|nr:hypothetical protein F2P56_013295 [Juglans regia]
MGFPFPLLVGIFQLLDSILQLLDPTNEIRHRVQNPVEQQRRSNQDPIPLALRDGLLVPKRLRRSAGAGRAARRSRLVLPVDVQEQEDAERDDREERSEKGFGDGQKTLAERVECWEGQQEKHYGLCGCRVA